MSLYNLALRHAQAGAGAVALARAREAVSAYAVLADIADDALAGARDLAIVLVLGDGGLRCDELAQRAPTPSWPTSP